MNSYNFEKVSIPKPQLKILCDGTLSLYINCINRHDLEQSHNCFDDFNNAFNCLKVLDKNKKK